MQTATNFAFNLVDFSAYIHALKRVSYEGGMSLECEWKDLEAQAGPAIQAIQQQIELAP